MYVKIARDRVISRTDVQITIKLRTCMYLAELINLLDFGVTKSKFSGIIMNAKIDRRITIKLKTWMN